MLLPRWSWDTIIDFIADHWLVAVLALAALAAIAQLAPAAARTIAAGYRRRREAYLQSEAWSFRRIVALQAPAMPARLTSPCSTGCGGSNLPRPTARSAH